LIKIVLAKMDFMMTIKIMSVKFACPSVLLALINMDAESALEAELMHLDVVVRRASMTMINNSLVLNAFQLAYFAIRMDVLNAIRIVSDLSIFNAYAPPPRKESADWMSDHRGVPLVRSECHQLLF
jgi:hypothetical protein